ncbi:MAG: hypothetical protein DMG06_18400 [Acidobacteria bacterium]|nr:MAG: hypothetical protein DMG06_18400 [Acidobacteriota bacterium]
MHSNDALSNFRGEDRVRANSPEEICRLFQRNMRKVILSTLYDREAVFLNESGETKEGKELRGSWRLLRPHGLLLTLMLGGLPYPAMLL